MDAIKQWWEAKGKAYAIRALHALWETVVGMVAAAIIAAVTAAIPADFNIDVFFSNIASTDWRIVVGGAALAAFASMIKSIKVGTPETKGGTE